MQPIEKAKLNAALYLNTIQYLCIVVVVVTCIIAVNVNDTDGYWKE